MPTTKTSKKLAKSSKGKATSYRPGDANFLKRLVTILTRYPTEWFKTDWWNSNKA